VKCESDDCTADVVQFAQVTLPTYKLLDFIANYQPDHRWPALDTQAPFRWVLLKVEAP